MQHDHVEVWDKVLDLLKTEVHPNTMLTWFGPIRPLKIDDKALTIQVPNQFSYEWVEQQYGQMMNHALSQVMGNGFKLIYSIRMETPLPAEMTPPPPSPRPAPRAVSYHPDNLNARYCFDSYVEGECNKFAKAAALAVAKSPGSTTFNPLVVYGGVGLGKTHLIQAIGNYAKEHNKATRVLYVDSERFTADFINSIQKNKTTEFSGLYRNVDILMIDDIQFFGNKEKTQDEFFHTFNALHQKGKQIILSSDRPPKELHGMEERMKSRFQWGLVVDIQPPDFETRQAILQKKAEESSIDLPPEIFHFIATHITSNIRELEGAMIRLLAFASLNGKDITLELAKKALRDVCISKTKAISIEFIQKTTAEHFSFPDDLLRSKTRKKEIAQARQICMYLCKTMTDSSLKTIGLHFGGRDHSTVIHAINCTVELMQGNIKYRESVETIKNKIEISQL
jgi:chromosomal replication initiator protein